jgi:general secretion pathway protein G
MSNIYIPPNSIDPRIPIFIRNDKGFTLIELIVITAILGLLAVMAYGSFNSYLTSAKNARCEADVRTLEKDISAYLVDKSALPATLNDIGRAALLDPWGNPYQYQDVTAGAPLKDFTGFVNLNEDYDLYSKEPDGLSAPLYADTTSKDDIARAGDGGFVGLRF